MFALIMRCRAGLKRLNENPLCWEDVMHDVTVSVFGTEAEAWAEAKRLRPIGFNRERVSFRVE